ELAGTRQRRRPRDVGTAAVDLEARLPARRAARGGNDAARTGADPPERRVPAAASPLGAGARVALGRPDPVERDRPVGPHGRAHGLLPRPLLAPFTPHAI